MRSRILFILSASMIAATIMTGQFKNFVTVSGDKLMDGTEELRFVSYNIPNLHYVEDNYQFANPNPWRLPDEFEIRDALTSIKIVGGKITRMYVMSVRKEGEEPGIIRHVEAPEKFNEDAFRTVDKVLQVANEVGVRVIIPFVDNWPWWGGPREYAAFRGKPAAGFWSDTLVLADMKATIAHLINRTNTYTGVKYRDDKAILCWETGNEMEPPAYEWTRQIAAYVKSLDTNHLVSEGTNKHTVSDEALNDTNVDIVSTHNYGHAAENIPQMLAAREKTKGKKPLFIGEFGFIPVDDMRAMIDTVIDTGISGIMVWSMRSHAREGGFYYHTNAYRIPGFPSGDGWDERAVVSLLREKAFQIDHRAVAPIPVPQPPVILPIESPSKISWQGSAGASSYIIERREERSGVWTTIADHASDADIAYRPLFSDVTAEVGKQYYYRISARSESGVSAPSASYGPVFVDHLTFVDEFENEQPLFGRMGELTYLHSNALSQAKEDKNRLAGSQGDYIVYKMPHIMMSLSLDAFATKDHASDIRILTGATIATLKPLAVKKEQFAVYKNEYHAYVPVRYSTAAIPSADRFIKIMLANDVQLGRLEVNEKHGTFTLASLIGDGMVLQQQSNVPLWGTGVAGAAVTITPSWGKGATAQVAPNGSWMTKLATPKAGGPYTLTIREYDTAVVVKNVLVGEVWLASGQSNMEMPLAGWPPADTVNNAAEEIAHSASDMLRMFTVPHALSLAPESSVTGSWISASPAASGRFSATAYFFARALQRSLKVPVGIIHSSWGGTQIEPWISAEALSKLDAYKQTMTEITAGAEGRKKFADWLHSFPIIDVSKLPAETKWKGLDFQDAQCSQPAYDDSQWKEMKLPQNWERTDMGYFDGTVWFRKTVEVPASWLHKKIILELGPIDDMDRTFVDGALVGGIEVEGFWNAPRVYQLPDSLVKKTTVSIAVRVVDNQGGGGIFGSESQMVLRLTGTNETVPIAGTWKYLPVASYDGQVFSVFGEKARPYYTRPAAGVQLTNYTPTAIYNAMIAPLLPYTIKGVIWYQGESNISDPEMYKTLLPAMIADWRTKFMCGEFPFYYVQIAPFRYGPGSHSELLREAQLLSMSTKNAGMAVTLDIGTLRTIHPSDKQDVGERLALWALAKNYGRSIPYTGPVYTSMKKTGDKLVLMFDHAGKGLVLKGTSAEFQIAGADKIFKPASVELRGKTLVASHPALTDPVAVRYAFTDTSSAILFNADGLPASSFRTDAWK